MKPEAINAIIDGATGAIKSAKEAQAELEERKHFAEEAERRLGYKPLSQAVSQETINVPADVVLLKALVELDIRPLDRESVLRYMMDMSGNNLNLFFKGVGFPLLSAGLVSVLVLLVSAYRTPGFVGSEMHIHWLWPAMAGLGFFMVWAEHAIFPRKSWRAVAINNFFSFGPRSALLPREVLAMALRVKDALGLAELRVHQLEHDRGPRFKVFGLYRSAFLDPDPFLEVRFGGESYFIAVWDEPGFDGKLMRIT